MERVEEEEEDNPVVQRIPVYFNRSLSDGQRLCVLQYPLRPAQRPYDIENIEKVRYKPNAGKFELELPLDTHDQNFDGDSAANLRIDRRMLTSTDTPVDDGYCIAVMRDGVLHLAPVDAVYQMRPSLAHLDVADEHKKEQDKVSDAEYAKQQQQGHEEGEGEGGYDATPAVGAGGPSKLMPLQVQVKRRETERQAEMRLHSHAHLKQLEEEERWLELEPVFKGEHMAQSIHDKMTALGRRPGGDSDDDDDALESNAETNARRGVQPAGVPIPAGVYLDALCPITSQQLFGGAGDVGFRAEGAGLSKAQLDGLPLELRVHALFARGQRTVLRFARVMHFAPAGSTPEDVIAALLPVAHLVQGCWVAASALRCGGDARREQARDAILLHFSRDSRMQSDVFGRGPPPAPPPGEHGLEKIRREILAELAVVRVSSTGARGGLKSASAGVGAGEHSEGWSFIEATDREFIDAHPELARREAERWQSMAPWLEADPAAAAALRSPPLPDGIDPAVSVKAQTLVLPSILSSGVVKLAAVRALLEHSGDPKLAPLALLREPEMMGLLGGKVVSIDGACALHSIGDAALDPFRGFLLKLLRTRGRTVRRTDVMEGAAAALGAAPTNSVYKRCMDDLCVSRGSTWAMKTGEVPKP